MKKLAFVLGLTCGIAFTTSAQMGPPNTGLNGSLLQLFGDNKAFTTKAEIHTADSSGKEVIAMPATFMRLDNRLRIDIDLNEIKNSWLPPQATAMLKQTGMDKTQMLIGTQTNAMLVVYPGLQAYAPVPESAAGLSNAKEESTELGKETVDGHPCVKKKVTTTDSKGKTHEALVWSATDLKGFPVKLEMNEGKNTVEIRFSKPSFEKPDAKSFEAPTGYTKYDSIQSLMQTAMMKMFGGGAK